MTGRKRLVAAAAMAAAVAGIGARDAQAAGQVGDPVPQYALQGIDGLTYSATGDLGKVVFVFLFGYS